jgi:hypothetical protein
MAEISIYVDPGPLDVAQPIGRGKKASEKRAALSKVDANVQFRAATKELKSGHTTKKPQVVLQDILADSSGSFN